MRAPTTGPVHRRQVAMHLGMLADLGRTPGRSERILDFGCGRRRGGGLAGARLRRPRMRLRGARRSCAVVIEQPYRLPYDDESFDIVVSDQVFEHVRTSTNYLPSREIERLARRHFDDVSTRVLVTSP